MIFKVRFLVRVSSRIPMALEMALLSSVMVVDPVFVAPEMGHETQKRTARIANTFMVLLS